MELITRPKRGVVAILRHLLAGYDDVVYRVQPPAGGGLTANRLRAGAGPVPPTLLAERSDENQTTRRSAISET